MGGIFPNPERPNPSDSGRDLSHVFRAMFSGGLQMIRHEFGGGFEVRSAVPHVIYSFICRPLFPPRLSKVRRTGSSCSNFERSLNFKTTGICLKHVIVQSSNLVSWGMMNDFLRSSILLQETLGDVIGHCGFARDLDLRTTYGQRLDIHRPGSFPVSCHRTRVVIYTEIDWDTDSLFDF